MTVTTKTTNTFFQEPQKITLRDTEVLVSPLAVKNISKAAQAAAPLIEVLSLGKIDPLLVMQNADTVISLCALACNQTEEWVGELNGAELVALLTLVIGVNSDFFVSAIMPQAMSLVETVKQIAGKVEVPKLDGKKA